jgi:GTP cyclohydrolase II
MGIVGPAIPRTGRGGIREKVTAPEHAQAEIRSLYGRGVFHVFSWGTHEEDNILAITAGPSSETPLVRVQSACYTAEIFRSTDCDCHEQLDQSLSRVHAEGGAVIYMLCDGRGAGLLTKVRGLALGADGLDTADAYKRLGVELDPRDYEWVADCLKKLGLGKIRLLTNNPRKIEGLRRCGLILKREPLLIEPTTDSIAYLRTKQAKMGQLLELPMPEAPD